jgi:UPF0755 protein
MSAPVRERARRHHLPPDEWPNDPWDDPDITGAMVVERSRRSRWPVRAIVWTIGSLLIIAVLVAGSTGWWYINQINPKGDPGAPINFTVNPGETVDSLSVRLQDEGFITNARVFRWYVDRQGGLELTPGYYALRPRDHMGNLMRVLGTPPEETYSSVTFPEGFTVSRMANRLAEKVPRMLVSDFMAAANDGSIRSEFQPETVTSLEGLLFPDTYQVSNGESPGQVVQRMVALMERVARQEQIVEKGYGLRLTAYEVLIVASMIEREAKVEEDRPMIARVILNRLAIGMPLQIDATLFYNQDPSLPFDQLKSIDSPYNTYLHLGLPPTPIANPGRASIEAAVNPSNNPPEGGPECQNIPKDECLYLYYVLADEDGGHAFALTLAEHEANVQKARDAGLLP